ncbi:hypothetical protein NHH73_07345 [Oxalobacteraceae bacterium OTU3CINTB1]|nr:hypothetical protein NHH73_07345 [Oxalobacteraceae bacterium OTU3CINTB1]
MDSQIIYLALAVLAFAVALNLKLTISVLHAALEERDAGAPLTPGEAVPQVSGQPLAARFAPWSPPRRPVLEGRPAALLFLASGCPKCHGKLAELERLLPAALHAGLDVRLVSHESAWRLRRFLGGRLPSSQVLRLRRSDYRLLNPTGVSPAYLFVDHAGILEARGFIGDDNWLALRAQLLDGQTLASEAA